MNKHFDVTVVGVGSMGAAASYYLSKYGLSVLGIEQFDIPHDQGSHAGQSRIIRKAYFEHPDYVPLLHRAYENWATIERETSTQLYFETGLFYAGIQ
ncbi:MAG: FAD-dependent oxidoreductase, partial [Cytophagales bacterium]